MLLGDGATDLGDDRRDVLRPDVALGLLRDDEPLLALDLHGEGRAGVGADVGVAAAGGPLDVLGIDVAAPDDDEVLEPPRDEQLALAGKAQVARPQEGTAKAPGERPAECLDRGFRLAPIPLGDARPGDPDFADAIGGAFEAGLGIDDRHVVFGGDAPAGDQHAGLGRRGGDPAEAHRGGVDGEEGREGQGRPAGNEER